MRSEHRPTRACRLLVLCCGLAVLAGGCGDTPGKVAAPDAPRESHEVELKKLRDAADAPRKAPPAGRNRR